MRILYNQELIETHVYKYTINQGGELNLRVSNGSDRHVYITFKNGKLECVEHNIDGAFEGNRSAWYVLGAIAEKITELEQLEKLPERR